MAQSSYAKYVCSKCGHEELVPTGFCRKCGNNGIGAWTKIEPLADLDIQVKKVCSVCGKNMSAGDNFCPEHGATIIEVIEKDAIVYRGKK
jgi:predicted RNA-binding Zn-ribbon protein involved in translation (DUF1610 family)